VEQYVLVIVKDALLHENLGESLVSQTSHQSIEKRMLDALPEPVPDRQLENLAGMRRQLGWR
jgi:hypothetical protein